MLFAEVVKEKGLVGSGGGGDATLEAVDPVVDILLVVLHESGNRGAGEAGGKEAEKTDVILLERAELSAELVHETVISAVEHVLQGR